MLDVTVITPSLPWRSLKLARCINSVADQETSVANHLIQVDLQQKGPVSVRNNLARNVETEWIAFLDDDDVLLPHHFSKHKSFMVDDVDVVFSWCDIVHEDGGRATMKSFFDKKRTLKGPNTLPITVTMRKSLFDKVGGFPDKRFEDWELWKAISKHDAVFRGIEEVTWEYCLSSDGRNQQE